MEFELLNELVDSGYEAEDLDELYEFAVEYILEYEEIVEQKDDEQPKDSKAKKIAKGAAAVGAVGAGGLVGSVSGTISGMKKNLKRQKNLNQANKIFVMRATRNVDRPGEYKRHMGYAIKASKRTGDKIRKSMTKHQLAGAGIGAGLTAAGIGAKALHNRYKKKKENS